jgi:thiol-disulfide isomerase/thioredoxin
MRNATPLLAGLTLLLAGCGRCCDAARSASSSSSVSSAEDADGSCCDSGPARFDAEKTAVVAENKNVPTGEVDLKLVKLDQVLEAVKAQAGKVVVLDIWATFCVPCKKEFPRLVKLHEQHAKDGLVCMSLSVDDQEDLPAAFAFLKSRRASFANFLIEGPAHIWQNHFVLKGVPAVFVWDRAGNQAARFDGDDPDNQFTYDQVEKKVALLLQAK